MANPLVSIWGVVVVNAGVVIVGLVVVVVGCIEFVVFAAECVVTVVVVLPIPHASLSLFPPPT